jgi:hypothetical protein
LHKITIKIHACSLVPYKPLAQKKKTSLLISLSRKNKNA